MTTEHDNRPTDEAAQLNQEAYDWVVRFVSGGAGPAEIEALKQWSARSPAHAEAFDRARKVWDAFDPARRQQLIERASNTSSPKIELGAARVASISAGARIG